MTREEKQKAIDALKISVPATAVTQEEFDTYIQILNKVADWLEQEPCEDAVSREAVNTLIDELARAISDERCCISRGRNTATIMQDILDLPPVTPNQKTAHWIDLNTDNKGYCDDNGNPYVKCSECGYFNGTDCSEYCPECGAKMEGVGK